MNLRALLLALSLLLGASPGHAQRLSLDRGWLFQPGDLAPASSPMDAYEQVKAGNAGGAAGREFDDSDWRHLDLPHDWAVEAPFDPKANMAQGYRPRGIAWYRRYLRIDESERGRHFELQFDGIATHAQIWVNGHLAHRSWSGYTASHIDITPYVRYGDARNTVAIRVDANAVEGWWYEGAGIYRHAWLIKRNALHVVSDGLNITPQPLKDGRWRLPVAVSLANSGAKAATAMLDVRVTDPQGRLVAQRAQRVSVAALGKGSVALPVELKSPQRWALETPLLYSVSVTLKQNGKARDELSLSTGFRTLRFDADRGFFLNEQRTQLQGVCIHQDHAGVGVALPDAIWAFRLRRLKELGVNAIRFAHHAPAPEVLDLADRMGFLVMDENRNFNAAPENMAQLEWMVTRDRHHPSIILWSVFNEEPVQGSEVGYEMVRRMVAAVKTLDATRPVTAAMNGGLFTPLNVAMGVDVVGFNYQVDDYDRFHKLHPRVPLTSSEDTSAFMTRGVFETSADKRFNASYDDDAAQWGKTHRDAWNRIAARPYLAGGFVWSGFDYRGEPTPWEWPAVSTQFGIMDLNGFPKTAYFIHQAQWIHDRPVLNIAPHWNWPGREGQPIRVMVMGNMERVRLLLNGREIGEQPVDKALMNFFSVPYEAGRLEAIGFTGGREVARSVVETTGPAVALELLPDRTSLQGDGQDAMPITVRALDAQGRAVPVADAKLTFQVSGAGRSIGHGNGDPTSHEGEKGPTRALFMGLAQLIVQVQPDALSGEVQIEARADGLAPAKLRVPVHAAAAARPAFVPPEAAPITQLMHWRISPPSAARPDPLQALDAKDMNTWGWGEPPMQETSDAAPAWRVYRTQFTPRKDLADGKARLRFSNITGHAEVWLDGQKLGEKTSTEAGPLDVALPAGNGAHQLRVLVQGQGGKPAGIAGAVELR